MSLDQAVSRRFFNIEDCPRTTFLSFLHLESSPLCLMTQRTATIWVRYSSLFPWECVCVCVCMFSTASRGGLPSDAIPIAGRIHPPQRLQRHTPIRHPISLSLGKCACWCGNCQEAWPCKLEDLLWAWQCSSQVCTGWAASYSAALSCTQHPLICWARLGIPNFCFQFLGPPSEAEFRFRFWFQRCRSKFFFESIPIPKFEIPKKNKFRNSIHPISQKTSITINQLAGLTMLICMDLGIIPGKSNLPA